MTCRFLAAELALEWWRASGERTTERLTTLVDHWLDVRRETDPESRQGAHQDALDNRHSWEIN